MARGRVLKAKRLASVTMQYLLHCVLNVAHVARTRDNFVGVVGVS